MQILNQDYSDLLAALSAHKADFLIVGAHAMAIHGHPRATKDLDIWVRPTPQNARLVMDALNDFGAALHGLTIEDLSSPGVTFQMGTGNLRIDILTEITGVDFETAWEQRTPGRLSGHDVNVLSRELLIENKSKTGRGQDLVDVENLRKLG